MNTKQDYLISFETGALRPRNNQPTPVQPYDGKYIYDNISIEVRKKSELDILIPIAQKTIKESPDMTYIVLSDQGQCLFLEIGDRLYPTTPFSYASNKVLFSIAKINGKIQENFICSSKEELEEHMYSHMFAPMR